MSTHSDDLISLWLHRHDSDQISGKQTSAEPEPRDSSQPIAASSIPRQDPPVSASSRQSGTPSGTEAQTSNLPLPQLSGKLADHLSKQPGRSQISSQPLTTQNSTPWVIDNLQTKAAIAMSLVLASHLTRFAGTILSEQQLTKARDSLLHTFNPKDAVMLEVEAYDLLTWFAGTMDESWQLKSPESDNNPGKGETSQSAVVTIISNAIHNHRDLLMRYYTGSRGEFSERRITPIEITAEKYLIAFCHLRQEERVFRLSRIVQLSPILEEGEKADAALCYPNIEDTKLPPLPELPEPTLEKPHKTRKRSASEQKEARPKRSKMTKSPKSSLNKKASSKSPKTSQDQPKTPSLFDFDNTKKSGKKKTAPEKKSRERSLFDDN